MRAAAWISIALAASLAISPGILASAPERNAEDAFARGVRFAHVFTEFQAHIAGVPLDAPAVAAHESPSGAIRALLGRWDLGTDPAIERDLAVLDALPPAQRTALTRVVDAYMAYDDASRTVFDGFLGRLQSLADATASDAPSAWDPNAMRDRFGPGLGPLFAARLQLLDEVAGFRAAFASAPRVGVTLVAPPALGLDLAGGDNLYSANLALSLDVGGNDRYLNNAGGSRVLGSGCSLVSSVGAAAVDLAGTDRYESPESCGTNGGGSLGSGFLLDAAGDDFYSSGLGAINGGGRLGVGFLLDTSGSDAYIANSFGVNGGGSRGYGLLIDVSNGSDTYLASTVVDNFGSNGGGDLGVGTLVDEAGADSYVAGRFGSNGHGNLGVGLLLDLRGRDTYLDAYTNCTDCDVIPKGLVGAQVDDQVIAPGPFFLPPVPIGVPTQGPDADGDGVPAYVSYPSARLSVGGPSLIGQQDSGTKQVALDPNDADPSTPLRSPRVSAVIRAGCQTDAVCVTGSASGGALGTNFDQAVAEVFSSAVAFDAAEAATGLRPVAIGPDSATVTPISPSMRVDSPALQHNGPLQSVSVGAGSAAFTPSGGLVVSTPGVSAGGTLGLVVGSASLGEPQPLPALQGAVLGLVPGSVTVPVAPIEV